MSPAEVTETKAAVAGPSPPGTPAPAESSGPDPHLVYFKAGDPACPFFWSLTKKWTIILVIGAQILWIVCIGSSWSPANSAIAADVGVAPIVARVAQAMYLIGFSFGPIVLTPISEDYGRKTIFIACLTLVYLLHIPIALAQNIETLMICRFLAGFMASPIFNSCCCIPDMWPDTNEFISFFAINIWALTAEAIVLGPIWGSYITRNLGWRWLWGISAIVGIGLTMLFAVAVPETRHSVLLQRRVVALRAKTGDSAYFQRDAIRPNRSAKDVLVETVGRPLYMVFTEPIVNLTALYDGMNYAVIYLAVEAVPIIYEAHGINDPEVQFIFLAVFLGYMLGVAACPIQFHLARRLNRKRGQNVPEGKLLWGFFAGVGFPISLFAFAWLSIPSIHWFAGMPPLVLFGAVSHILFICISDYTIESYLHLTSSAVTGQSFAREAFSAIFIIVGEPFYHNLGPPTATSILGGFATVLGVIPFAFYRYGPAIRERSHYSHEIKRVAEEDARMRAELGPDAAV